MFKYKVIKASGDFNEIRSAPPGWHTTAVYTSLSPTFLPKRYQQTRCYLAILDVLVGFQDHMLQVSCLVGVSLILFTYRINLNISCRLCLFANRTTAESGPGSCMVSVYIYIYSLSSLHTNVTQYYCNNPPARRHHHLDSRL